ncbi:MAG: hypothetical protein IPH44_43555 [Myxococcales bacterium]|nr:hypothetical protein [Myxococcales bacterium]
MQLAHDRGVDVLVVAGDAADVEHHRDRPDLGAQSGVGVPELPRERRRVARQPCVRQRLVARQLDPVEREAQEFGEARLTRAVEAGDPGRGLELEAARLGQLAADAVEQADVLLVDAARDPLVVRVIGREAAGDDVLVDLRRSLAGVCSWK